MSNRHTKARILVELDNSKTKAGLAIIRMSDWDYLENEHETGITARCDDGTWKSITQVIPSYAEYHSIDVSSEASLDQIKSSVSTEFGCEDEFFPWFIYDGSVLEAESDSLAAAKTWLERPIDILDSTYEDFGVRSITEFGPGFDLLRVASSRDHERLSIREADLGGPGSSVPCVIVKDDPALISEAFDSYDLGYVIVS